MRHCDETAIALLQNQNHPNEAFREKAAWQHIGTFLGHTSGVALCAALQLGQWIFFGGDLWERSKTSDPHQLVLQECPVFEHVWTEEIVEFIQRVTQSPGGASVPNRPGRRTPSRAAAWRGDGRLERKRHGRWDWIQHDSTPFPLVGVGSCRFGVMLNLRKCSILSMHSFCFLPGNFTGFGRSSGTGTTLQSVLPPHGVGVPGDRTDLPDRRQGMFTVTPSFCYDW